MDSSEVVARSRFGNEERTGFRCAKHLRHNDAGRRRYVGAAIEEIEERGEELCMYLCSLHKAGLSSRSRALVSAARAFSKLAFWVCDRSPRLRYEFDPAAAN